jgi:hypothetical protein
MLHTRMFKRLHVSTWRFQDTSSFTNVDKINCWLELKYTSVNTVFWLVLTSIIRYQGYIHEWRNRAKLRVSLCWNSVTVLRCINQLVPMRIRVLTVLGIDILSLSMFGKISHTGVHKDLSLFEEMETDQPYATCLRNRCYVTRIFEM